MKNKRGWIRLVEAFLSILLVAGMLVIMLNQQKSLASDSSNNIADYEIYMLRSVELSETLRTQVAGVLEADLPASWESGDFPAGVKTKLEELTPASLDCAAQICETDDACSFSGESSEDIYAQKIFIISNYNSYAPRQLKLFCWLE